MTDTVRARMRVGIAVSGLLLWDSVPGAGPFRTLLKAAWLVLVARKDTRGFYDSFSAQYDALVRGQPTAADASRFLREHVRQQKLRPGAILELGCGTGLYSQHLGTLGGALHGVDFSRGQLEQARSKGLGMVLAQGDILTLPYRDASFDVVTSFQVLPHFPGQEGAFFKEAYRVLKPGGVFVVDPVSPLTRGASGEGRWIRLIGRVLRLMFRFTNIRAWTEVPTAATLTAALVAAGFRAETHERQYAKDWRFLVGTKPGGAPLAIP